MRLPHLLGTILAPLVLCAGCLHDTLNEQALFPSTHHELIPEDLGLEFVPMPVEVDGAVLSAWFFPAERARAAVIVIGGNAGNMSASLPFAEELVARGYHAVLMDHRGFGLSTGSPDLWSLIPDARAVLAAVRARPEVEEVGLVGISLGSVVALGVAEAEPDAVAAVVVEGLFLPEEKLDQMVGSFLGFLAAPFVVPAGFDPADQLADLPVPVKALHGTEDGITPLGSVAEAFAGAAGARAPRSLWIAEGAGHAPGVAGLYREEYAEQVARFFDRWLGRRAPDLSLRTEWRPEGDGVVARVTAAAPEVFRFRTPVELAAVSADGEHLFARGWLDPGGTGEFPMSPGFEPVLVNACVPTVMVYEKADGTWGRASRYHADRLRLDRLRDEVYRQFGYGPVISAMGANVLISFDEGSERTESLGARCEEVQQRLAQELDRGIHPAIRPFHLVLWRALGRQWEVVGERARALAAYEVALLLVPREPARAIRLDDASWELGMDLDLVASTCEDAARVAGEPAEKEGFLSRAREWRRRAEERVRRLAAFRERYRPDRP